MTASARIYQWINTAILTGIIFTFFHEQMGITEIGPVHALASAILFAALAFLQSIGKKGYIIGVFLLSAFAAFPALLFTTFGNVSFLSSFAGWLAGNYNGEGVLFLEVFQTFLFTGTIFALQALLERFPKAKAAAALLLAAYLTGCMLLEQKISHTGTVLAFVYLLLAYTQFCQRRWKKERRHAHNMQMLWLLPFFAVYSILLFLLPSQDEPYDWRWVKQACLRLEDSFLTITQSLPFGSQEDFDTGYAGISDFVSMPGILADKEQEIMLLQTKNGLIPNIYLTGQIYDTFDGRHWTQTGDVPAYGRLLDALQTAVVCKIYNPSYTTDYIRNASLNVRYLKFHTGYLFVPLKTSEVSLHGQSLDLETMKGAWRFSELKSYGTEYELDFSQMNTGQDAFYRFLEKVEPLSDREWAQILSEYERFGNHPLTREDISAYETAINAVYGNAPLLPDSVQAWLADLTGDCMTDIEKLRMIEKELSSYTYHTSPGALPGSVTDAGTFLEYFLTQHREGYCVHYATAFVLLARAIGIPARYVQGYLVPMKGKMEITVTSDMAHAWPEVYIDGAGWIPFEPTPGYGQTGHAMWSMRQESAPEDDSSVSALTAAETETADEAVSANGIPAAETEPGDIARMIRITGKLVCFLLLFLASAWYLERRLSIRKYRRMEKREQFLWQIRQLQKLLSLLGCQRSSNETIQEFRQTIPQHFKEPVLLQALAVYEDMYYGNRRIEESDILLAVREKEALQGILKKSSYFRYLGYCLFFKS